MDVIPLTSVIFKKSILLLFIGYFEFLFWVGLNWVLKILSHRQRLARVWFLCYDWLILMGLKLTIIKGLVLSIRLLRFYSWGWTLDFRTLKISFSKRMTFIFNFLIISYRMIFKTYIGTLQLRQRVYLLNWKHCPLNSIAVGFVV